MTNGEWERVTKTKPCEICKRPNGEHVSKWCGRLRDGSGAVCMFVESKYPTKNGGYFHRLGNSNGKAVSHAGNGRIAKIVDMAWLSETYRKAATSAMVVKLAVHLGVSFDSLRAFDTGWDGETATTPMRIASRKIVGIQRRWPDGTKRCVNGSKGGLFIPNGLNGASPLFVVEGVSDAEALYTIGLSVVGVYNAGANGEEVVTFAAGREIVIVADNDAKLKRGFIGGRIRTARLCKQLRKAKLDVTMIHPPKNLKDARQWVQSGITREDVLTAVDGLQTQGARGARHLLTAQRRIGSGSPV